MERTTKPKKQHGAAHQHRDAPAEASKSHLKAAHGTAGLDVHHDHARQVRSPPPAA